MKDKKKISIIAGVLLLVLLTIGVTYAFFSYIGSGTTENTISSDSITFLYEEIDQQGAGISINDALPVEDSVGKQGQAFNFRIISNTNSNVSIPYEINVRQKEGTDDIGDIVKLYLTKVDDNNNEEEVELSKYSELRTVTKNNHQEKLLHADKVPASDSGYNQRYRLRMWIDSEANFSDGSKNNKTFAVTVNVYSSGHVQTEEDIQAAGRTDITSFSVNNTVLTETSTDHYEMGLENGTTEATINIETTNPYTKVVIEKTDETYTNVIAANTGIQKLSTSKKVSLNNGANYFRIRLISEDGTANSEKYLNIIIGNHKWDFNYIKDVEEWTVPLTGVYQLEVWGASGADSTDGTDTYAGGYGGYSTATVNLTKNSKLDIVVGGEGNTYNYVVGQAASVDGGYNGGGAGGNGVSSNWPYRNLFSGGGATHIAIHNDQYDILSSYSNPSTASNYVYLVAGGGGSGAAQTDNSSNYSYSTGGSGGGTKGGNITILKRKGAVATGNYTGGTQTSGYAFGQGYPSISSSGSWGAGGGWYGGAMGSGGSGYINTTLTTNGRMVCYNCMSESDSVTTLNECYNTNAVSNCSKSGNGHARITYLEN